MFSGLGQPGVAGDVFVHGRELGAGFSESGNIPGKFTRNERGHEELKEMIGIGGSSGA